MMGLPWFRQGEKYQSGQLGNVEAVGLGFPGRRHKKVTANDTKFALAA